MADFWMDVDTALAEVPVNLMPLVDDDDFVTIKTAVAFNEAGMDLRWNFVTTGGAMTSTAVTPTSGGDYDWAHQGDGIYSIEIPASAGASINNDTEGFGWFTGLATDVAPWRGPTIGFRAAALNNALIDGTTIDVNVTAISGDTTAADNAELMFDGTGYAGGTTKIGVDVVAISGDTTAADNAELMFDGTGYAGGTTKLAVNVVTVEGQDVTEIDQAQSVTGTTIVLATGADSANDTYIGYQLTILSADTGAKQNVQITDYVGASRTATIAAWPSGTPTGATIMYQLTPDVISSSFVGTVDANAKIADNAIDAAVVATGTITTATFAAGAINAAAIAQNAIDDDALAADVSTLVEAAVTSALGTYDPPTNTEMEARTLLAANYATAASLATLTTTVGAAGAGLTAVPWNAAWDDEVQSEATDALNTYDPPTNTEFEARTLPAADYTIVSDLSAIAVTLGDNAIDADTLAADLDLYTGTIELVDDDSGTTDRWVVMWRKNGVFLSTGVTTPTLTVTNIGTGSDLFTAATLTHVGSTIFWRYSATAAERITSGVAYGVTASATIDGSTRTIGAVKGRDTTT
jgi:hypothetical protein